MSFFRNNIYFFTSFGAGLALGIMYWRMTNRILFELQQLSGTIAELRSEVLEMKEKVALASSSGSSRSRRSKNNSDFFSIHASSGDEDEDIYEEAFGGEDDDDSLRALERQILTSQSEVEATDPSTITDSPFAEVDKLLEGTDTDKQKAYDILQSMKEKYVDDAEYNWRLAKTTYQVAQILGAQGNTEQKKQYMYTAKDLAEKAIGSDPKCANAHKWFAITIGSVGEYEGTQQKIKNGFTYKEHIEIAININPQDPSNHYLLGRWCYSVYMLSWIEKKAAAALYATPPTATIDETLTHFLKADELNPGKWKDNILFIGKCYIEKRQYREAVKWLEIGHHIPAVSQDDKTSETEISKLLTQYKGY